ncbi:DENN domain-containing protein 1A-like isoform X1 [Schistocerca americana]|uniref:DENN domain-containing protein 1A-like isoform X1 n=1 Tax=Schistocerca americana TaxID=7009 RepID=UPI001F4F3238|nr:DENN domain-containing protein 1A-like isoform X1 [Schistocerca americana]XP_049960093.1 DENN domain-containing protein 1A-like isoform X1 [Schistocerca serialis cubense]
MGSRIRDNIKHLFQCFCEVVAPRGDKEAWIIQKFPDSYRDEEVLKSVPKFAYPCEFRNTVVQHYSFVLTSIDSKWTFGFCRHDPKTETALVILSFLPWHESFYKLLNHVAEITHNSNTEELYRFLNAVYEGNVPEPGTVMQVPFNNGESIFICKCPNQFQLPSIPENRNLTEYYSAVDGHNMMVIFASMLYERRIIFTSKKLSRLSACVQSANAVIYPMNWQHIFIPVLPMALMDYLFAPMPYLIGVPEPVLQRVKRSDLGEVIILDADSNTVETPFEDLESLPADVVNSLKRQLRNRAALLGDGVSRAFLKALVQLIGGYRDALKFQQGQKITFDPEAFIESRPMSMQPFLRKMLQLQIFQQFIEERLDMLNSGLGFSDEFEMEACNYSGKSSSKLKQQYKDWTSTMKKEGTAFFKTVKSKANPAMKSAVKTVRERGKEVRTAYKGIRSKWRDSQPRDSSSSHEGVECTEESNGKPRSAPTSPINKRRQTVPGSKVKATVSYRRESNLQRKRPPSGNRTKPYCALSPLSDQSPSEGGPSELSTSPPAQDLTPLDMNLMGDLQDIFKKCSALTDMTDDVSPPVDRTLKPVRSLESFKHSPGSGTDLLSVPVPLPKNRPPVQIVPQTITPVSSCTSSNSSSPEKTSPGNHLSLLPNTACTSTFDGIGCDLFGATPFIINDSSHEDSLFVVASTSSIDMVRLPPPAQTFRNKKPGAEADLIRLDSTPSDEDFDPLLSRDQGGDNGISSSAGNFQPSSQKHIALEGLTNPLYPYFVPSAMEKSPVLESTPPPAGNRSFLYSASTAHLLAANRLQTGQSTFFSADPKNIQKATNCTFSAPSPSSKTFSQTSVSGAVTSSQDLDLLREYGLDFNNLSIQNGNTKPNSSSNVQQSNNIFENLVDLSDATLKKSQTQWTKFD